MGRTKQTNKQIIHITMVQQIPRRAQLKQELLEQADSIFANHWDNSQVVFNDDAKQYTAKSFKDHYGIPVVMTKWHCEGLTAEQWARWEADPSVVADAVQVKMTRTELPDDEGHMARILKMKMPWPISDRSTVTVFYNHTKDDGSKCVFHSSKGNEHIVQA